MKCGPINMLYTLVSGLDSDEFEIHAVTLKLEPSNSRIQEFEKLGVIVHPVSGKSSHLLFGLCKSIQRVVDEIKPDVVHSHGPWADYYLSKLKVSSSVMNIHNKLAGDYIPLYGPIVGRITTIMDARAMRTADVNISVSHSVAKTALKQYGIKSGVIYNGVDIDKYYPCDYEEANKIREQFNMNKDSYVFLHIGNLISRKRPIFLASAFVEAMKFRTDIDLYFLGDGPLLEECKSKFGMYSNIHFEGNVNAVDLYMKASDAMVSATISDGLSMATLEGLACGLKSLMSDIDVHREIKQNIIIDPDDFIICNSTKKDYADNFIKLANSKRENNSVPKGILSGENMSSKYAALYKKLAAGY